LLECVDMIEARTGKRPQLTYSDENRVGDHICYYSDLSKLKRDFPAWDLEYDLDRIVDEIIKHVSAS